jgi:NAD(P)H-flavin reductase
MRNPYLPKSARVVDKVQETHTVFTLRLALADNAIHEAYEFKPGQFNMLYLYGVGEIPISIVSDPKDPALLDHTIRAVGRVSRGLSKLKEGDSLGLRGPYGSAWPLTKARQKDVLIITGGLGCAPVVSVVNYIIKRRAEFGKLTIMQGVKLPADLIWREQYERWVNEENTEVYLAANQSETNWPWHVGLVTELFDQINISANTIVMMCGPEGMMRACVHELLLRQLPEQNIYLSMERNMQCAMGHCGHCQYGHLYVCKDGPVFNYTQLKRYFSQPGI